MKISTFSDFGFLSKKKKKGIFNYIVKRSFAMCCRRLKALALMLCMLSDVIAFEEIYKMKIEDDGVE